MNSEIEQLQAAISAASGKIIELEVDIEKLKDLINRVIEFNSGISESVELYEVVETLKTWANPDAV